MPLLRPILSAASTIALALTLSACGDDPVAVPVVDTLEASAPDSVLIGASFTATSSAFADNGAPLDRRARWSSSDTLVVRIDSLTGVATVVGDGEASLMAAADGAIGTTAVRAYLPRIDTGGNTITSFAVGDGFACGWQFGMIVACRGSNSGGALGRGTMTDEVLPIAPVAGNRPAGFVVAAGRTTCAIGQSSGDAWCWGEQVAGGATGTPRSFAFPRPENSFVSRFAMGAEGTACATNAVTDGNSSVIANHLVCWGRSTGGLLGGPTEVAVPDTLFGTRLRVIDLAVGTGHACARARDAAVTTYSIYCWGAEMQNFTAVDTGTVLRPTVVPGVAASLASSPGAVFVTRFGSCVLTGAGRPLCWGRDGGYGELPGATAGSAPGVPGPFMAPRTLTTGPAFVALSSSPTALCGRTSAGEVWCWGKVGRAQSTRDGNAIRVSRRETLQFFWVGENAWCGGNGSPATRVFHCQGA